MKVLGILLLAVAVTARPELRRESQEGSQEDSHSAQDSSASLPSGSPWRVRRARDLHEAAGAQIPVQLVYGEEDLNRVSREPNPGRAEPPACGRPASRRRRSIIGQTASNQQQGQLPAGPSIVKLKVRRGGVAIAGPGGVATAGSGGTAIVGPGGTAYTTPDGTAVVGPGGRLIQLSPYVVKGRSAGRLIATGPVVYYPLQI